MKDTYLKIVLQALGEKIDNLSGEVYIKDLQIEKLKEENERLKKANEELKWHLNPLVKGYENMEGNKNA